MKVDNVLGKMAEIVEKRVELYKADFYMYDTERIGREKPREFAWLVRPTGTHLVTEYDVRWYELFKSYNDWFYHVKLNEDGSGEVTLSEKRCDEFARRSRRFK